MDSQVQHQQRGTVGSTGSPYGLGNSRKSMLGGRYWPGGWIWSPGRVTSGSRRKSSRGIMGRGKNSFLLMVAQMAQWRQKCSEATQKRLWGERLGGCSRDWKQARLMGDGWVAEPFYWCPRWCSWQGNCWVKHLPSKSHQQLAFSEEELDKPSSAPPLSSAQVEVEASPSLPMCDVLKRPTHTSKFHVADMWLHNSLVLWTSSDQDCGMPGEWVSVSSIFSVFSSSNGPEKLLLVWLGKTCNHVT